jgi:hypothetical protein
MALSVTGLKTLCRSNIVEIKFVRRTKNRIPPNRRILCTLCSEILNGRVTGKLLNFKPPRFPPPYDAEARGLLTVWDILMQDWRNIPVESCVIVKVTNILPEKNFLSFFKNFFGLPEKNFLLYFNNVLKNMTAEQKKYFMEN